MQTTANMHFKKTLLTPQNSLSRHITPRCLNPTALSPPHLQLQRKCRSISSIRNILSVPQKTLYLQALLHIEHNKQLRQQNESLRNYRKNRRYRKQRFPLGKAYETQIQSQFEDQAFLEGRRRPLDYPESICCRN